MTATFTPLDAAEQAKTYIRFAIAAKRAGDAATARIYAATAARYAALAAH